MVLFFGVKLNFLEVLFIPYTVNSISGEVENSYEGCKSLGLRRGMESVFIADVK